MNIGINGYEAVVPRFGYNKKTGLPNRVGSSEYCFQLLLSLSNQASPNNYFIYLPQAATTDMPKEREGWKYVVFSSKKLWTLIGLSKKLFKNENKLNVFFSPTHYLPFTFSCPSVVAILDVSYLHFPHLFNKRDLYQLKFWGRYSISKAKAIITISQSSKNDIIKKYHVDPSKIFVIYPGIKQVSSIKYQVLSMEELQKKFGIGKNYILFVGTIQPRKNVVRLIEAFSLLVRGPVSLHPRPTSSRASLTAGARRGSPALATPRDYSDLQLVVIGKKGWQYEKILEAPKKFNVEDKVKFLDSVSDEELPSFYKNAKFFILPSLYEGFGLPVLEAMKYGCAVIASNVSSLPEAGGDAALYVDPNNTRDITEKMEKLLDDQKLREEMIKKGYRQIEKFSWEKSARETLKVLESVS